MKRLAFPAVLTAAAVLGACADGQPERLLGPSDLGVGTPSQTTVSVLEGVNIRACTDVAGAQANWLQIKVEPAQSGTYTGPDGSQVIVTINDKTVSWTFTSTTSDGVDVFVNKNGPRSQVVDYRPEEWTADSRAGPSGPSHLLFCYDKDPALRIALTADGLNFAEDTHPLQATVWVDVDRDGNFDAGEDFNAPGASVAFAVTGSGTVAPNPATTNADGIASAALTSGGVGTDVVNATASFLYAPGQPLTATTNGVAPNSGPITKLWVDAAISIRADATNGITEGHTFAVEMIAQGPAGTSFDFGVIEVNVAPAPDGGITGSTCGAPDESVPGKATCQFTINSSVAGTFVASATGSVTASGTVNGAPQTDAASRSTDGQTVATLPNSGPATKIYVDLDLTWNKVDQDGNPLGGATFSVCRIADRFGTSIPAPGDPCLSVLDDGALDADKTPGSFRVENQPYGTWEIKETAAPSGYTPDPTPQLVTVTDVSIFTGSAARAFVNVLQRFEGCTPGFWRNHTELWPQPYAPGNSFFTVFGIDATMYARGLDPALTLGQAINLGGGDFSKLARHGTAGLLNAASSQTAYAVPNPADVISAVRAAFLSGQAEPLATMLDSYNNAGCDVR